MSQRVSAQAAIPPAPPVAPPPAQPAPAQPAPPAAQPPPAPAQPPPDGAPPAAQPYPAPAPAAPAAPVAAQPSPYAYPAPVAPTPVPAYPDRPAVAMRLPSDASVRTSPWFDLTIISLAWGDRIEEFMNIGVQIGGYFAKRVRVAGRVYLPTEDATDSHQSYNDFSAPLDGDSYVYVKSEPARLLYGADVGIVAANTASFVLSPGIMFMRTDVSDYGTMVGLALPFEWVTATGLRVGFEFDVGRAFGGSVRQQCTPTMPSVITCNPGDYKTVDRDPGTAFMLGFELGWGFNHPDPEPVSVR